MKTVFPDCLLSKTVYVDNSQYLSGFLYIYILSIFILRPEQSWKILRIFNTFLSELVFFKIHVASSVNRLIFTSMLFIIIPLTFLSALILFASISRANIKRYADRGHRCLTPRSSGRNSEMWSLLITTDYVMLYILLIYEIHILPKLTFNRVFIKKFQFKESNAFSKSIQRRIPGVFIFSVNMFWSSIIRIFSPFKYQFWSWLIVDSSTFCSLFANKFK